MATIYVADVNLALDDPDLLKGDARVKRDGQAVSGALVAFELHLPDGTVLPLSDDTNLAGVAKVEHKAALAPGNYTLVVTGVTHPQHTYNPAANVESQASITV